MNDVRALLERISISTLERHAFMLAEPIVAPPESFELSAALEFSGWRRGSLTVRCQDGFCLQMYEELLGSAAGTNDPSLVNEVLLEFVNVLAGCVISELSEGGRAVKLSPPALVDANAKFDESGCHRVALEVDGNTAEIILALGA